MVETKSLSLFDNQLYKNELMPITTDEFKTCLLQAKFQVWKAVIKRIIAHPVNGDKEKATMRDVFHAMKLIFNIAQATILEIKFS